MRGKEINDDDVIADCVDLTNKMRWILMNVAFIIVNK